MGEAIRLRVPDGNVACRLRDGLAVKPRVWQYDQLLFMIGYRDGRLLAV